MATFNNDIRDVHEVLFGQCDCYLKISGGNAHLAFDRRDIHDLSKLGKENPNWFLVTYKGSLCKVTFVLLVPVYSFCNLTDFVIRMFLARDSAFSVSTRTFHMALLLLVIPLVPILRHLGPPPLLLLIGINFLYFMSMVSREMVLVFIASKSEGSLPEINFSYCSLWL